MPAIIRLFAVAQLVGYCFAQGPAFDLATVKVADSVERTSGMTGGPGTSDPGRVRFGKVALISVVATAFGMQPDQVSGPAWIGDMMGPDKYDVMATMAPGTTKEQFRTMLQRLLAERFELAIHHETRKVPGYDLVTTSGGARLNEARPDEPHVPSAETPRPGPVGKDGWPTLPPGPRALTFMMSDRVRAMFQEKSMADLAAALGQMIVNSTGDRPATGLPRVADKTGLTGTYTFRLEFACARCGVKQSDVDTGNAHREEDPVGLPNIFKAIEKQLGLSLAKAKSVEVDHIVVDHALKIPTAN